MKNQLSLVLLLLAFGFTARAQLTLDGTSTTFSGLTTNITGNVVVGTNLPFTSLTLSSFTKLTNSGGANVGYNSASDSNSVVINTSARWVVNGGFLLGRSGAGNLLMVTNSGDLDTDSAILGGVSGGADNNVAIITGPGSQWTNATSLTVGLLGDTNRLFLSDTALLYTQDAVIGSLSSDNVVVVTNFLSVFSVANNLVVGSQGDRNRLSVVDGGSLRVASSLVMGETASSTANQVTVADGDLRVTNATGTAVYDLRRGTNTFTGGKITVDQLLMTNSAGIFEFDGGTLITRGATIDNGQDFVVGLHAGFAPATWDVRSNTVPTTVAGNLYLGLGASYARLLITNGGTLANTEGRIGDFFFSSNNAVIVSGANSAWNNSGHLYIESPFTTLLITNGGTVSNNWCYLGSSTDASSNTVTVSGTNSLWTSRGNLEFGVYSAFNTLLITNGGTVISGGGGCIGFDFSASNNAATVTGTGSAWNNRAFNMYVGAEGAFNTLLITNGGNVNDETGYIGNFSSASNNTVTVSGANSVWNNHGDLYVGEAGAFNTLLITNGGNVNNAIGYIGDNTFANNNAVIVSGANSTWNNSSNLYISSPFNTLMISNGGKLVNTTGNIGDNSSARNNAVIVNGANSVWNNRGNLFIRSPFNTLLITNGGTVSDIVCYLGYDAPASNNAVTVSGTNSVWTNFSSLELGLDSAFNTLLITNGGTVISGDGDIGVNPTAYNNAVTVTGTGSAWKNTDDLSVGKSGAFNTLLITNGGVVRANSAFVGLIASSTNNRVTVANGTLTATNASATSVLDIRRGTNVLNSGLIEADSLLLTNTLGVFEFNGGSLNVRNSTVSNTKNFFVGNGTSAAILNLVGNGVHTYANSLTLRANGTLTGNGAITGFLTVQSGGKVSPGPGIGRISLDRPPSLSGVVQMEVSKSGSTLTNDVVAVNATLTYDGALVVTNIGPDVLVAGNNFKLFNAISYAGGFSSLTLPPLASGLSWIDKLLVDGSIEVTATRFWTNAAGGNYQTAANWSPNLVPTILDDANFTNNASYQVAWTGNAVTSNVLFSAASGTVTQAVGGFTWQVTNSYVLGPVDGQSPTVQHISGTLRVTNATGNATLEIRRGTNVLNGGVVEADNLLLTNTEGFIQFNGGTLITQGATIDNGDDFVVGLNVGFAPATWDLRSNAAPTTISKNFYLGFNAPNTTMLITNGGKMVCKLAYIGSQVSASNNTMMVSGSNSAWNNLQMRIGDFGSFNTLLITNGGTVSNNSICYIGYVSNANNNVAIVSGTNSTWNNVNDVIIGLGGAFNTLLISNGGTVNNDLGFIGDNLTASNNAVMVSGPNSTWNNRGNLILGYDGAYNTLLITGGGVVTNPVGVIGDIEPSIHNVVTVSGSNSLWNNGGELEVGNWGSSNTLLITNNGTVRADSLLVGRFTSSTNNRVMVEGGTLTVTNATAKAALSVQGGTNVLNSGVIEANNLLLTNTLGFFEFNGGSLNVRTSTVANAQTFFVGNGTSDAALNLVSNGLHTYANGLTLRANGSLTGNGSITGSLIVQSGGTLAPGNGTVGKISVSSPPSLSGIVQMEVSKTGATLTNDVVAVTGTLTYGGALVVNNLGPSALLVGDSFKLFNATSYAGSFTSLTLPLLTNGLGWTNKLLVDGSIQVFVIPPGDRYWTNTAGGIYQTDANWVPNVVPTILDNANFTNNADYQVAWMADAVASNAFFSAASGTVTQAVGGFTWQVANSYVLGPVSGQNPTVQQTSGTLRVTNVTGNATMDIRRGTNVLNGGVVEADRLLLTNFPSSFQFNGGTLITRGASISNHQDFAVGLNAGFVPATWDVRSNAVPTTVTRNLYIGSNAANSTMLITNGGTLNSSTDSFFSTGSVIGGAGSSNAVTVSGNTSAWNDSVAVTVGSGGAFNTLLIANGGEVATVTGYLGGSTNSSNNAATVSGISSVWNNSGNLYIGDSGAFNTLLLTNGGTAHDNHGFIGESKTASNNVVTVSGLPSAWYNTSLSVGFAGAFNTLLITNRGTAHDSDGHIGELNTASNNAATVSGPGSAWDNTVLYAGDSGAFNTLLVANGGTVSSVLGGIGKTTTASNNAAAVSGVNSAWNNGGLFFVGGDGAFNTLLITNGGAVISAVGHLGLNPSASNNTVTVSGTNSAWYNYGNLLLGDSGAFNTLLITNGGSVSASNAYVGFNASSTNNRVTVANGTLTVTNASVNALLDIRRGTNVLSAGLIEADVLLLTNTLGIFEFNGGTLITRGATISNGPAFVVGYNPGLAPATWDVRNSAATTSMLVDLYIGSNAPNASVLVTNGATLGNNFGYVGFNSTASNNSATVSGSNSKWNCLNSLYVGFDGASNTLLIANGGSVSDSFGLIGNNATSSNNSVTVSGPTALWTSTSGLKVGSSGAFNTLLITNGAKVVTTSSAIGSSLSSSRNTATVTGAGSAWNNSASMTAGNSGAFNTLLITNGGVVNNTSALLGFSTSASNSLVLVTGSGSAWNNNGSLTVGNASGFNTLLITNGGVVTNTTGSLGASLSASNNVVTVNGAGSLWKNGNSLTVGSNSVFNRLFLTNGGAVRADSAFLGLNASSTNNRVTVVNGTLTVTNVSSTSVLDIRRGTNALNSGLIEADILLMTNTLGTFEFNGGTFNVRASTVANTKGFVVGDGTNAATLNLVGNGTHTYANGVTLRTNGALTGNGNITGLLTVQSGGTLAPGNSVGKITLSTPPSLSGTVRLEVSKTGVTLTNDVVAVTGTLTYGGSLVVTNLGPDTLVLGNSFKLFNATSFAGGFTNLTLPTLTSGLSWANKLLVDGSIAVVSSARPVITGTVLSGTNLIFSVTGGTANGTWSLLSTTNVALPLASWPTNRSGIFDALGGVTLTNGINFVEPQRYYSISTP